MGIRTERITGPAIAARLADHVGETVQLVTWQGLTYLGRLVAVEEEVAVMRDLNAYWYNRKRHTHRVSIGELRELVIDRTARY